MLGRGQDPRRDEESEGDGDDEGVGGWRRPGGEGVEGVGGEGEGARVG